MRPRLRHRAAIAVTLSVMLSTLGTTHVSCDAMPTASEAADHAHAAAMPADEHAEAGAGNCERADETLADRQQGQGACALIAHCVAPMLGIERVGGDPVSLPSSPRSATNDSPPRQLATAPDSPPPRA